MEVSKVPILRLICTISSLSMPISGCSTGSFSTAWVEAMASMVWLATWPRFSPVTMARAPLLSAIRSAMRIMKRRMIRVKYSSGHLSRISSWMCVKGTTSRVILPHQAVSSLASSMTFSLACWEV